MANVYNHAQYSRYGDEDHLDLFEKYVDDLKRIVVEHGWDLKPFYRTYWCAFKPKDKGVAAFGIAFHGRNSLYVYMKDVEAEADAFPIKTFRPYNHNDRQAEYLLIPGAISLTPFIPLLEIACQKLPVKAGR